MLQNFATVMLLMALSLKVSGALHKGQILPVTQQVHYNLHQELACISMTGAWATTDASSL